MARYHRMNRAHSHEGVVTPPFNPGPVKPPYYHTNETEEDEGEWSEVEGGLNSKSNANLPFQTRTRKYRRSSEVDVVR